MAKTSLFSPRSHKKKQVSEEEFALEKQRLEREIKNKEFDMFALQDEIKYKDDELKKTKTELDECRRTVIQLKKFKETAEECEILTDKISQLEKQRDKLEERLVRAQDELQQMKHKCAEKDQIEAKARLLESELSKGNDAYRALQIEVQRLRTVEGELKHLQDASEDKERNIYRLIESNSELEKNYASMRASFDRERVEFKDKVEEAENRNAELECECNLLRKQLSDLNESIESMRAEFDQKVRRFY